MTGRRFDRRGREARVSDLVERAVARAKRGDIDAVHFLYVRFVDEVHAFVSAIVSGPEEAAEVTDRVFAKLPRRMRAYEGSDLTFPAWILCFAEDVARSDESAPRQPHVEHVAPAALNGDAHSARSRDLRDALRRLPDEQRRVLVLRHIAGLSPKQVAERLDSSEARVRDLDETARRVLEAVVVGAA
jgi:RNA polymerase sigma-70 factor (ECF subfamily)